MNCKICDGATRNIFDLPAMKATGGDLVPANDDGRVAHFYECERCRFLFSDIKDAEDGFYEHGYTGTMYTPEPGSEVQYMRLLHLAAPMLHKPLWACRILDYGCGVGHFVKTARHYVGMDVYGYDLARNAGNEADEHIFSRVPDLRFDIIVAREVIEHFVKPRESFETMKRLLKPGGVIAFQTNLYEPGVHDRTWGYVGPLNGHISLYSRAALHALQEQLDVSRIQMWRDHATVVAWKLRPAPIAGLEQAADGLVTWIRERWRMRRARRR
jgi:SAM-dependent methyltransferase